ncbi:Plasmodium vivax Vir protein, putative [Plasmodium vivax]|uniref:Vir protein, putative n=1 Tax=Plasmodium vivax TaxID=5855 RepID=A0A1G4EDK8_PLAVI|nr:Plasmodium vivax Vir protein, putative [Plasmodium vivax]
MAPRVKSRDFSQLFQISERELYSEKFYDAMDMESDDLKDYDDKCSKITVKKANEEIIQICKKYLRFLDTSKEWIGLFSVYDVSLLLNYWLYEKLIGIYGEENNEDIILGFTDLQMKWGYPQSKRYYESYYQKCKPKLSIVNHKDWKNRKELYDYYVDFNHLYNMAKFRDEKCEHYNKIKEKSSLYDHFAPLCESKGDDCPDFYEKCEPYNPKNVLHELRCHAEMQAAPARALHPSPDTRDTEAQTLQSDGPRDYSQFQPPVESTQDTHSTSQSSDIKTKVTNSVLGAAPVLLTATMLYRVPGFAGSVEAEQII